MLTSQLPIYSQQNLQQWKHAAPEGEDRQPVANDVEEVSINGKSSLSIEYSTITEMPPLPPSVNKLRIISCKQLGTLPTHVSHVETLYLSVSPAILPIRWSQLTNLTISHFLQPVTWPTDLLPQLTHLSIIACWKVADIPVGLLNLSCLCISMERTALIDIPPDLIERSKAGALAIKIERRLPHLSAFIKRAAQYGHTEALVLNGSVYSGKNVHDYCGDDEPPVRCQLANGEHVWIDSSKSKESSLAAKYFEKAALAGHVQGAIEFSLIEYQRGEACARQSNERQEHFKKAADHGHVEAAYQYAIALKFKTQAAGSVDYSEVIKYFKLAADSIAGHQYAAQDLGILFSSMIGDPGHINQEALNNALLYFRLAASSDDNAGVTEFANNEVLRLKQLRD